MRVLKAPVAVRVMTLNLLFEEAGNRAGAWHDRRPLVVEVIRSHAPDVFGVQEANSRQIADLLESLPGYVVTTGPDSGAARLPRPLKKHMHMSGEYCAIFYRMDRFRLLEQGAFWLSRTPHVAGSAMRGTWLPRVVNWVRLQDNAEHKLSVHNAHFDFLPWAPTISARMVRRHLDEAWDGSPQILLGDFNSTRFSTAFRHLTNDRAHHAPPFRDAWLDAKVRRGPAHTYHAGSGRAHWLGRLDRILYRPAGWVERASTDTLHAGDTYPSDHFPLFADLAL